MPTGELRFEPGQIVDGKVQGITNFGAFIELAPGVVGLVHISEIADTYVKEIKDFLKENDAVKVKVLSVDGKRMGLSIKQAQPKPVSANPKADAPRKPFRHDRNFQQDRAGRDGAFPRERREGGMERKDAGFERRRESRTGENSAPRSFTANRLSEPAPVTLDDKIARFLKESDEHMQPLKEKYEHKKRTRMK